MKIIIATSLYPPEIEVLASYVKNLAIKLRDKHKIVIVAYASTAEKIPGAKLITISKRQPLLIRLLMYTIMLFRTSRGADVIYAQNSVTAGFPSIIVSYLRDIPIVINATENEAWKRAMQLQFTTKPLKEFLDVPSGSLKIRFIIRLQGWVLRRASMVTASSAAVAKIISVAYHVPSARITVNYNPPEKPQILPFNINPVSHQIVTMGRLIEWADITTIIRAIALLKKEFSDIRLLITGEGAWEIKLKELAQKLGVLEQIIFLGRISKAEGWYIRKASRVHIHLYNFIHEDFPGTILSSFSAELPVIAANIIDINEIISDEENGLLIMPGNETELAQKIAQIFKDEALRKKITANAQKILAEKFSWDAHIRILNNLFEK